MWLAWRHRMEYVLFRSITCLALCLSPRSQARLAEVMGWIVFHLLPRKLTRYRVAAENLRLSVGRDWSQAQIDHTIRRMWVHLFRLIGDILIMSRKLHLRDMANAIVFRNHVPVVRAFCSGRPVMLLSGHFGNWELAIAVFGMFGFRMGVVGRALDNPYLDRWVRRFRAHTGHKPVVKKGGYDDITELLRRRGAVAFLADQDAGPNGAFVDFFGRPASTHKSLALLALEYDALICVGYAGRRWGDWHPNGWPRYELGCEDVIDPRDFTGPGAVLDITQRFTTALERTIARFPEQYFWVHRRWKSEPRKKRNRAAA